MMEYTDDERIGLKVLLRELDAEPMRMVNQIIPELISESIGRLYIKWARRIDRDVDAGADAPSPSRDMRSFDSTHRRWTILADTYLGTYQYEIVEVIDWLLLAGAEHHGWLARVDDKGRPLKLMKCGTVEGLYNESVKSMRGRHPQRTTKRDLTAADERHVADLGLGYTVVELLSPAALDVESTRMRHCVGSGSYDAKLQNPKCGLYSVRDLDGVPRATVELVSKDYDGVTSTFVRQFMGPRNEPPAQNLVELFNAAIDDILGHGVRSFPPAPRRSFGRF
ncbi:hypothetical protein J2Y63_004188 [Shinella sp. BE166]|uniref:hypothetical protein n=1 Tax=Shinella sp. BE166 TaxID=3373918 RepID=UPI003EBAD07E